MAGISLPFYNEKCLESQFKTQAQALAEVTRDLSR